MDLTKPKICLITLITFMSLSFMPAQAQKQVDLLALKAPNLDPKVLELALNAHEQAQSKGLVSKRILTVIDYSKKSTEKRLWVFDLDKNKLIMETHVTHGEKSGKVQATRFSNIDGSHQSSLGVFTTGETYYGQHGYSLRLDGHESGINDKARSRAIVVHGADYASEKYIQRTGSLGLSWACPAVDTKISRKLIDTIKNGSVIFAYYPDNRWLKNSSFLN